MKKTPYIIALLITAIIILAWAGTAVSARNQDNELIDLVTYQGTIGTHEVEVNLSIYGNQEDTLTLYKVGGTIQLDGEEKETELCGTFNPATGELVLETSDGMKFRGIYDEDYGVMEGPALDQARTLAFNWQL
ncbi:MAG: hypothetical protein U0T82_16520 [Bacteroidales bacterium]